MGRGRDADSQGHGVLAVIDAIHEMCVVYGIQMRRAKLGGYFNRDGSFHYDGAAPRSPADKIRKEGEGAATNQVTQHFAEVLTGEALLVRRALDGMPEHLRHAVDLHYIVPKSWSPVKRKVENLRALFPRYIRSRQTYYDALDRAHLWIAARVPHETNCQDNVATQ